MTTIELNPAPAGTLSWGTLNSEHLARRFSHALRSLIDSNQVWFSCGEHAADSLRFNRLVDRAWECLEARDSEARDDELDELVEELFDALEYFTPAGLCFGSHPEDGADFGYWPIDES